MNNKIRIYEPGMCCPTGLCGPSIDPEIMRITTAINTLEKNNIDIKRFNLTSNPDEFVNNKIINDLLVKEGEEIFPVTLVDDEIVKKENYPTNEELTEWTKIQLVSSKDTLDEKTKEFVAIGAAIGSNCEMCFKYHYNEAKKLGASKEEIWQAVQMAIAVKETPAKSILALAEKICLDKADDDNSGCNPGGGCC
ncbi:MAG: arsenite efflux transporter metallochaperone ArsD [Candidatus Moranbacteria bacterium]|nr:arsenite efflux transporter metallochaperone ArsD [Candidatus Moranbacteria bacterium]